MTMLATRKTTCRAETSALYRGRPLIVTLEPHEILIRQKGRRTAFAVPYQAVIEAGMKLAARLGPASSVPLSCDARLGRLTAAKVHPMRSFLRITGFLIFRPLPHSRLYAALTPSLPI
jgi:hypothetical protein